MSNYFKRKLGVIIVFVVSLHVNKIHAQSPGIGKVEIYAPNTYAFAKYGDVPVEPSTGIPSINIPLVSFNDKDINLDISLSYYASGIKVDQEATWVGLGWSLNVGGVITRQTEGALDGYNSDGTFKSRTSIPDYDGGVSQSTYGAQVYPKLAAAVGGATDNGPDIFYYNFNGKAGRFVLDDQANGVLIKYEDLKVKLVHNPNDYERPYFTITDERGIIYEFKNYEITSPFGGQPYVSAWYLTRITSPSGGEINFEYKLGGMITLFYQKRYYDEAFFPVETMVNNIPGQYLQPYFDRTCLIDGLVPKKITSSSGNYVELNTSPNTRQDSENFGSNQLDNLVEYNYNSELIKKFKFSYSYFEANNSHKLTFSNNAANFLNYRLRLDAVQEVSANGELQAPYRFEYYGDNDPQTDDPYTLPYRLSPCQDHWGYYNNSYNQTIFPSNPADKPFHIDEWYMESLGGAFGSPTNFTYSIPNGGTREPDAEAVKAGCLNKITYPTGGYTNFNFEIHTYGGINWLPIFGGVRIKSIESVSGHGPAKVINYDYDGFDLNERCTSNSNAYYTWYDNKYDPNSQTSGRDQFLAAWGVPISVSHNHRFIVHIDGRPQIALGAGTNAVYSRVKESSPVNGYTLYEYNFDTDQEISAGPQIDGVPVPGIFESAYVTTQSPNPSDPAGSLHMPISSCTFPFPNFVNNDWRRGHLIRKEVWSESEKLLSQDIYNYDIKALRSVAGYKVIKVDETHFFYARYYAIGGMAKHEYETHKIFQDDGSYLSTTKNYEYSSTAHKQITKTTEYSSKGMPVSTEYYYPPEYGSTFALLKDKNILSPIDTRTYVGNRLVNGTQIEYNDIGQPLKIRKAESSTTDIPFNSLTPYTFPEESTIRYNGNHLIENINDKSGISKTYIWGYNKTYPIAEVINAQAKDIFHTSFEEGDGNSDPGDSKTGSKSKIGGFSKLLSNLTNGNYTLTWWQKSGANWSLQQSALTVTDGTYAISLTGQVDEVRFYPSGAMLTTYTYAHLIGMTGKTDPNNHTVYYAYDSFGRLYLILDQNKNILKRFCYNYAGQPEDCVVNTSSVWAPTGVTRCKPCDADINLSSNILQQEEKDTNPNSPHLNETRWVDVGVSSACAVSADWQNTSTPIRCKLVNGGNTGEQEQEQMDKRPCSDTYGQTRWVVVGTNTTACPLPCTTANCTGEGYKCVNNICEMGIRVCTESVPVSGGMYRTYFHYEYSDGSWSGESSSVGPFRCAYGNP